MSMNGPMSPWALAVLVVSGGLSLAALVGLVLIIVKSSTRTDAANEAQEPRTEADVQSVGD